jgi:eukaryotic-like serine/threonine-protein kinase
VADLQARLRSAVGDAYRIEKELGGGGMSRVFLAQERELERQVVVKVLPPEMAAGLNAERFRREIQLAASLQHPHIVPLLAAGHADDLVYYTMPLIEGESLRAKLAREGELPITETVRILRDVADALAYAHEHGVVHRDIKPDNVLIARHHAVVTDFGVAKALSDSTGKSSLTSAGVALGTPAYMAPEQAAADPHADHRCDIYALGALGYEMLTGRPPFTGATPQHVLAAQVTETPEPVTRRRATVPAALAALVMRCLEKSAADRCQTAGELVQQLEAMATPSGGITPTGTQPVVAVASASRWLKLAVSTVGLVIVVAGIVVLARPRAETLTLGTVTQITFEPGLQIEPAISPDGKLVAYAAGPMSAARIYVRQSGGRPVPLAADSGPPQRRPLWSPDGTRILFETDADLFVMPALGGTPRRMANGACCAAWSPDGRQVAFVKSTPEYREGPDSISVMPPDGGPSRFVALVLDPHSLTWSPDRRWLAFVSGNASFAVGTASFGNKGPSAIVLVPAVGGAPVSVTDNAALNVSPVWTPDSRHILFVSNRDGARDVYVVRLGNSGRPLGKPSRLTTGLNAHSISLSADGTRLAYAVYTSHANVWAIPIPTDGPVSVDRATQITTGNQTVEGMTVSPDERWLYFDSDRSGNADIYRIPLGGGEPQQLTTNPADDFGPNVSPDGRWVAFHSLRFGTRDIFVMPAEGGEAQRVTDDPGEERNAIWSPDGQSLSYELRGTGRRDGLYVISKDESGRWGSPRQVWSHPSQGRWSPDGRSLLATWTDGIWRIPAAGGAAQRVAYPVADTLRVDNALWSPNGRTMYVRTADRRGLASFWALPATGGRPRLLVRFDNPAKPSYHTLWATDGRRFYFTINDRQSNIYLAELHGVR